MKIVPIDAKIIPKAIKNWVSNPKTADFVQNTIVAVSVETGLKMIGRPTFIMLDKEADSMEKKKFAATKEMLYQGLCLSLYLSCMTPVKKFLYKQLSKFLSKNPESAEKINMYNAINDKMHLLSDNMKKTLKTTADKLQKTKIKEEALGEILQLKNELRTNKKLYLGKGAKELSAIVGSILMLTIVAPEISHFIIHPIMKALGMEKKEH